MIIARTATLIAEQLAQCDMLYIASDEQRAEAIASAVAAIVPDTIIFVPSSDALPGDGAPASPENSGRRVAALRRLRQLRGIPDRGHLACITSAEATARLYPEPDAFVAAAPILTVGAAIDVAEFAEELAEIGYLSDDRVDEPGEVAVRGEVIDIFPADAMLPARIEILEGRIVSPRSYDPVTQRTVGELDRLEVGRATEPEIQEGVSLLAHMEPAVLAMDGVTDDRRRRFQRLAEDATNDGRSRSAAVEDADWHTALKRWTVLDWGDDGVEPLPRFVERPAPLTLFARVARVACDRGTRVVLAGGTRDLRFLRPRLAKALGEELVDATSWSEIEALDPGKAAVITMPIAAGFQTKDLMLVAAADLLGSRAVQDDTTIGGSLDPLGGAAELRPGDVVVHEDHGIGVVNGIEPLPNDGSEQPGDAIALNYADGARRLVPVDMADRIWRYGADADAITLDKLDGSSWQKRRLAIDAAIAESARGLAALAAEKAQRTVPPIETDPADYERFAAGFAFTETPDQLRAIAAVRDDLASGKPMDRLVIGDVGYGKTEVALRAAAIVALSGGQVAIAAPTTVLARQHLESFERRFEDTGITVAGLSRLSTASEKRAVRAGLADGSIGVVVGTGAVAGKGLRYRSLKLVVIDEEQRFGAADKAKLRALGEGHVLSLSATPIPRTLQTALIGLQQLSIIATPPARRQPIRTTVGTFEDGRVRTALIREKGRGGQSFVVVPRIEDMGPIREKLSRLVPELKTVEAHGKLAPAELDAAMVSFASGHGDVFLATNIIEAGLDVPRANTMIVCRADRFGLSQLHQLRGRVGRGRRRGQILLLTDKDARIAERTLQRLRTLQSLDRLGAGFAISARDLDMRGAGDLLGEEQAGHMKLIGIDLYQHLLEGALRQARGETIDRWSPDLHIGLSGRLPERWIPEPETRISLYMRLARSETEASIFSLEEELVDRFGPLPEEAQSLVAIARLRCLARTAAIARIDAGPAAIAFTPHSSFMGDVEKAGLVPKGDRFLLDAKIGDPDVRLDRVMQGLLVLQHEE